MSKKASARVVREARKLLGEVSKILKVIAELRNN